MHALETQRWPLVALSALQSEVVLQIDVDAEFSSELHATVRERSIQALSRYWRRSSDVMITLRVAALDKVDTVNLPQRESPAALGHGGPRPDEAAVR
jgi:hypothetical protein